MKTLNKKTWKSVYIYLEAVLYGILVILTVFASIYGPILLKIIPIVFFLGIIGRIVFDRPVVTSLFGLCATMCVVQIVGKHSLEYNFIYSMYNFLCIMLGEMAGLYIYNICNSKTKSLTTKMAKNLSLAILTLFLGIFFNQYMNGNVFDYINAKNTLKKYISKEYSQDISKNVNIESATYLSGNLNYYSFIVSNIDSTDNKYKFAVYLNNKIIDGYYDKRLADMSDELNSKFEFKFQDVEFYDLDISLKYIDFSKTIAIKISKNVEKLSSYEIDKFCDDINNALNIIKEFDEFGNVYKINATLKSKNDISSGEILVTDFFDTNKYKECFSVEFFET